MDNPEYLICIECETPSYTFECRDGVVIDAVCAVCGNEESDQFLTESQYEELVS